MLHLGRGGSIHLVPTQGTMIRHELLVELAQDKCERTMERAQDKAAGRVDSVEKASCLVHVDVLCKISARGKSGKKASILVVAPAQQQVCDASLLECVAGGLGQFEITQP